MQKPIYLLLFTASGIGIMAALWAHAVSMAGVDPQTLFPRLWIFQLLLFILLLPLVVRALRRGVHTDPFGLPKRQWHMIYGLLVYYSGHFYFFMAVAAQELRGEYTWRMFSAGWILLFSLSGFFYWDQFSAR